jgi:hypothetical protein
MARLADSYSAFGSRPLPPVQAVQVEVALYVLEDTAKDLRAEAKRRARVHSDEAEGPEAQAAILDRAAAVLRGDDATLPASAVPAPAAHTCDYDGCGAPASNGFGIGAGPQSWACNVHAAQIEQAWKDIHAAWVCAEQARRLAAEEKLREPSTDMSGVGGRLI